MIAQARAASVHNRRVVDAGVIAELHPEGLHIAAVLQPDGRKRKRDQMEGGEEGDYDAMMQMEHCSVIERRIILCVAARPQWQRIGGLRGVGSASPSDVAQVVTIEGFDVVDCEVDVAEFLHTLEVGGPQAFPAAMLHAHEQREVGEVCARVIANYVAGGGVFVLCGAVDLRLFAGHMNRLGWQPDSCSRGTAFLAQKELLGSNDGVPQELLTIECLWLLGVPDEEAVFCRPKGVTGASPNSNDGGLCAIARHSYGRGNFIFVGDVNMEPPTIAAVCALIRWVKLPHRPHFVDDSESPSPPSAPTKTAVRRRVRRSLQR